MLQFWIASAVLKFYCGVLAHDEKLFDLKFHQNDYQADLEWAEAVRFNNHYVQRFQAVTFKFNRSCTAVNVTFCYHVDMLNDLEVMVQAYKFVSNEYRIFPAIRFEVNFCHSVAANFGGFLRSMNCGNFTGCPLFKNRCYHTCNFAPDTSRLPPLVPSGRYKLELQGLYRNEEMWLASVFAKVHRQFDRK